MKKICLVCDIPNWAFDIIAQKVKKNIGHITEKDIAKYKPARGSFKQTLMQNISETFAKKLDEYAKAFDVSVSDVLRACVLK